MKSILILGILLFVGSSIVGCDIHDITPEEAAKDQRDLDAYNQNKAKWDQDDAARQDLLSKGYKPEDVEAAVNTNRAIEDAKNK